MLRMHTSTADLFRMDKFSVCYRGSDKQLTRGPPRSHSTSYIIPDLPAIFHVHINGRIRLQNFLRYGGKSCIDAVDGGDANRS